MDSCVNYVQIYIIYQNYLHIKVKLFLLDRRKWKKNPPMRCESGSYQNNWTLTPISFLSYTPSQIAASFSFSLWFFIFLFLFPSRSLYFSSVQWMYIDTNSNNNKNPRQFNQLVIDRRRLGEMELKISWE